MHNADVVAESEPIDFDLNQCLLRKSVRRRVPDVVDFLRVTLIDGAVLVSEIEYQNTLIVPFCVPICVPIFVPRQLVPLSRQN